MPGSSELDPSLAPAVTADVELVTGSFFLMIVAAAPVPPVTLPVTVSRTVPFGHLPVVLAWAKFTSPSVVPLPPFQVIVSFNVPFVVPLGGFVKVVLPPALKLAGVHCAKTAVSVLDVPRGGVDTFEHAALCAADADVANGTTSRLPATTAIASARARTEPLIAFPPLSDTSREKLPRPAASAVPGGVRSRLQAAGRIPSRVVSPVADERWGKKGRTVTEPDLAIQAREWLREYQSPPATESDPTTGVPETKPVVDVATADHDK